MCGICGIYMLDGEAWADRSLLERMNGTMVHRGPDDEGYYISGPVGLAMRRLSIIDLAGGKQPITNEDESLWIVFNGEIYNHPDLRVELSAKGHVFRTRTDTEVILHLYEELGEDCVKRLREYVDAGARTVVLAVACPREDLDGNLKLITQEIMPAFQ